MDLLTLAKEELQSSIEDRGHPFRRFVLGTFGDYPEMRTVVSRKVEDDLQVVFYTDSRSPKVSEIRSNEKVSALFYHPEKQLQVRMKAEAVVVEKSTSEYGELLAQVEDSEHVKDYMTAAPPGKWMSEPEVRYGADIHFSVVKLKPLEIDILQLDEMGHERNKFTWEEGEWIGARLTP